MVETSHENWKRIKRTLIELINQVENEAWQVGENQAEIFLFEGKGKQADVKAWKEGDTEPNKILEQKKSNQDKKKKNGSWK